MRVRAAAQYNNPSGLLGLPVCRIRKGLPSEARVVARILPQFLDDFFPPQDVMNKVIGEFLSNQQPYPQFMATVVYKVSGRTWLMSAQPEAHRCFREGGGWGMLTGFLLVILCQFVDSKSVEITTQNREQ